MWSEVRATYMDECGITYVDAWKTNDSNEEGRVIAKVFPSGKTVYLDDNAKTDKVAVFVIESLQRKAQEKQEFMEECEKSLPSLHPLEIKFLKENNITSAYTPIQVANVLYLFWEEKRLHESFLRKRYSMVVMKEVGHM